MTTLVEDIVLFENLCEFDIDGTHYDLHNSFFCTKIEFKANVLNLIFKNDIDNTCVQVNFQNTQIRTFDLTFLDIQESLTIDIFYRGRISIDNKIIEFSDGRGFFYVEFYEGHTMEFWSTGIKVSTNSNQIC